MYGRKDEGPVGERPTLVVADGPIGYIEYLAASTFEKISRLKIGVSFASS
jgi:hypothetical protein